MTGRKTALARENRQAMTDAERKLRFALRDRRLSGRKFGRQVVIGPWIADFACLERRLVIEVDGGQHAASRSDRMRAADIRRRGFRLLRFWNPDVLDNIDGVLESILAELECGAPRGGPT